MAQVTLTGKFHAAGTYFDNGSFQKQPIIVEVNENGYVSYYPIDFQKDNIQKLNQVQATIGMFYTFTCFVQGSKNVSTDKNGAPAAYLNLSCSQIVPAQAVAPAPQAQPPAFNQPQAAPQGFAPQQPQGFAAPAQAPAPSFAPPAQPGIGAPQGGQTFAPPAPQAPQFAPPQPQAAPSAPAFNPNAGQQ